MVQRTVNRPAHAQKKLLMKLKIPSFPIQKKQLQQAYAKIRQGIDPNDIWGYNEELLGMICILSDKWGEDPFSSVLISRLLKLQLHRHGCLSSSVLYFF